MTGMITFVHIVWTVLAVGARVSASGLHAAGLNGLFQISPSFSGEGMNLYPGQHPDHDPSDLSHLIPDTVKDLYYTQEGHRPALHGAKHAHLKAKFLRPTIVLEHTRHIKKVTCQEQTITVCFRTPGAMATAQTSWSKVDGGKFHLVTYHVGCGDKSGKKRSFFEASSPVFDVGSLCVSIPVSLVGEKEALHSADLKWGTYVSPTEKRRQPVKGHVRLSSAQSVLSDQTAINDKNTVDLTKNPNAVMAFFNTTDINTKRPDRLLHDINTVEPDGEVEQRSLEKRSLWSWIEEGILAITQAILQIWAQFKKIVEETARYIIEWGETAISYLEMAFEHPFGFTYHHDFSFAYHLAPKEGEKPPPSILDLGNGFSLAAPAIDIQVECVGCGARGSLNIDGELSFSIAGGITQGEIELKGEMTIYALFGVYIHGQYPQDLETFKKELAAIPIPGASLALPGIFTLGAQVSISTAASLTMNGDAQILFGGIVRLSPGTARISLTDREKNTFSGFTPSFFPIFRADGHIQATADFGIPIALEFGLDVLTGTFKATVGLVDSPSVYVMTEASSESECQGVEMRVGAKNRIYLAALEIYEYTLRDDIIFETNPICLGRNNLRNPSTTTDGKVFSEVEEAFGGKDKLAANDDPKVNDVAESLTSAPGKEGFRILMDANETSIVVTGADGYVYLADKDDEYDFTAPLGTLDTEQNMFSFDVLGRLLHYNEDDAAKSEYRVMPLRVSGPRQISSSARSAVLSELKTDEKNFETYGMTIPNSKGYGPPDLTFFPTACQIEDQGLRLFVTLALVMADSTASALDDSGKPQDDTEKTTEALQAFGADIKKCRTVRLTSSIKGEVAAEPDE